jgi:hypothetical protein
MRISGSSGRSRDTVWSWSMSDHPKFVVLKPDWLHGAYPSYH